MRAVMQSIKTILETSFILDNHGHYIVCNVKCECVGNEQY